MSSFDSIHTAPARVLFWEGDLAGPFWEFTVSWWLQRFRLDCGPLLSPDIGLGKTPPTFSCFYHLRPWHFPVNISWPGWGSFVSSSDRCLLVSLWFLSHRCWCHTSLGAIRDDCHYPLLVGCMGGTTTSPVFVLDTVDEGFDFAIYIVCQICGKSDMPPLPPSSQNPSSNNPANLEKVSHCRCLSVS